MWTLSGSGRDFWKSFEIVEGLVCPRTGRAYWVHASSEGGRVLTTGTFVVNHQKDSSSFSSCCSLTQASWISNQAWCKRVTPYLSFEFVKTLPHDDDKKNPQDKDLLNQSMTTTTITTRTTNSGGTSATTVNATTTITSRTPTTRPPVPAQISYPGTSRVVARCSTTPPTSGT